MILRPLTLITLILGLLLTVVAKPNVAIRNANIVDVVNGRLLTGQTILIHDGQIISVGKDRDLKVPFDAEVIEARGKFVIPGLWDMHVHLYDDNLTRKAFLPLFLVHGITGIREMSGDESHLRLRNEIAEGLAEGPRMYVGALVDGPNPWPGGWPKLLAGNAEEARLLVKRLHSQGYDFIKTYQFLSPEVYRSIHKTARGLGMEVTGEIPMSVSLWEAAAEGHKSVEHLTGVEFACSSEEERLRLKFRKLVEEISADLSLKTHVEVWNRSEWEPLASLDNVKCDALFRHLAAHGTWVVPTLAIQRWTAYPSDPSILNDPRGTLLPSGDWDPKGAAEFMDPEGRLRPVYEHRLRSIRKLNDYGVGILAGTDLLGGFLLHDEIETYVANGLSPLEALRTATLNPAKYLERTDELGSVAEGKLADLVILDANPLEDISNIRKINSVISNGKLYRRADLDRLLENARTAVKQKR